MNRQQPKFAEKKRTARGPVKKELLAIPSLDDFAHSGSQVRRPARGISHHDLAVDDLHGLRKPAKAILASSVTTRLTET
jgi:hypothetical protein